MTVKSLIYSVFAKKIRICSRRCVGGHSANGAVSECCVERLDLLNPQSMAEQDLMLPGKARGSDTVSSNARSL